MAHRLAPEAAADLDEIWYYTARESGSVEIADRLIDTVTERFSCSPRIPTSVAIVTTTCAQVCEAFPLEPTLSSN